MQLDALKLSGEELRRAKAALAGPSSSRDAEVRPAPGAAPLARAPARRRPAPDSRRRAQVTSTSAAPGAAAAPAHAPLPLKSADPVTRELALAAQRFARAAQRQPGDFEACYNHGLALQELAVRAGVSRAEQLRLLAEARARRAARATSATPRAGPDAARARARRASAMRRPGACASGATRRSTTAAWRSRTWRARPRPATRRPPRSTCWARPPSTPPRSSGTPTIRRRARPPPPGHLSAAAACPWS